MASKTFTRRTWWRTRKPATLCIAFASNKPLPPPPPPRRHGEWWIGNFYHLMFDNHGHAGLWIATGDRSARNTLSSLFWENCYHPHHHHLHRQAKINVQTEIERRLRRSGEHTNLLHIHGNYVHRHTKHHQLGERVGQTHKAEPMLANNQMLMPYCCSWWWWWVVNVAWVEKVENQNRKSGLYNFSLFEREHQSPTSLPPI